MVKGRWRHRAAIALSQNRFPQRSPAAQNISSYRINRRINIELGRRAIPELVKGRRDTASRRIKRNIRHAAIGISVRHHNTVMVWKICDAARGVVSDATAETSAFTNRVKIFHAWGIGNALPATHIYRWKRGRSVPAGNSLGHSADLSTHFGRIRRRLIGNTRGRSMRSTLAARDVHARDIALGTSIRRSRHIKASDTATGGEMLNKATIGTLHPVRQGVTRILEVQRIARRFSVVHHRHLMLRCKMRSECTANLSAIPAPLHNGNRHFTAINARHYIMFCKRAEIE